MKKEILSIVIIYSILSILSFSGYLSTEGFVGISQDWAVPSHSDQLTSKFMHSFYMWDDVSSISAYSSRLYYGIFEYCIASIFGLNGEIFSKFLVPFLMVIAALTMFYLGKTLKFSGKTAFLMGLFYMLTPVLYNRVIAGHHLYIFAYALSPLFFLFLHKYVNSKKISYLLASSLILGFSAVQIQFLFMLFFMGLLYLFIRYTDLNKKNLITSLVVLVFIAILLNSFWLLPNFLNFQTDTTTIFKGAFLDYHEIQHATKTFTAFPMIGYNHNYDPYYLFKDNNLPVFVIYSLLSLVIVSLSSIIIGFKKKENRFIVLYSSLLLIFGLFFVSAVNGPLPELWRYLYLNIPILAVFREVYHSMFIIAFAYILLLGVFMEGVKKKLKSPVFKKSLLIIILISILLAGYPSLNSHMNQLQVLEYTNGDVETYNFFRNDSDIYRVMYMPSLSPIKHPDLEKPSLDLLIKYSPKPTFSQHVRRTSAFESIMQYYTISAIGHPEQLKAVNALISRLGVKYVICRSNYTSYYPYYIPMRKYLTDVYKNTSFYDNWMDTNLICNNIMDSSGICRKFDNQYVTMLNNSMPIISTTSSIVNVFPFSKILSLIPILGKNTSTVVMDPMQEKSFFTNSISNNIVIDESQILCLYSKSTKFIIPNTPYYEPGDNWATDLYSWYIHPSITLAPIGSGNIVLTWSNPKLRNIPDLDGLDLIKNWHFAYKKDVDEWKNYTSENQFNSVYKILWDKDEKALKTELYNSTWGWKTIRSPLIPVEYGKYYNFAFKVKGENACSVHAYIREFDENEALDQESFLYYPEFADGTFDWKETTLNYTPENESTRYLQLQIWHGHETDKPLPNIVWVKNVSIHEYSSVNHYLDTIWIYSVNSPQSNETVEDLFKVEEKTAEVLSYTKINPTLWKTKINASKPFMLSFAESYDPLWAAYVDGTEYQPVPLYSVINGFWIDKTGDLEIVIKYKPQDWFEIGLLISITTFLSCTGYLLYDWKKGDERMKMIKKKLQELLKRKK